MNTHQSITTTHTHTCGCHAEDTHLEEPFILLKQEQVKPRPLLCCAQHRAQPTGTRASGLSASAHHLRVVETRRKSLACCSYANTAAIPRHGELACRGNGLANSGVHRPRTPNGSGGDGCEKHTYPVTRLLHTQGASAGYPAWMWCWAATSCLLLWHARWIGCHCAK